MEIYPVYPCVYREHDLKKNDDNIECGLSLCIQGTRLREHQNDCEYRFIPVYTGNTHGFQKYVLHTSVYPCVYREHDLMPSL